MQLRKTAILVAAAAVLLGPIQAGDQDQRTFSFSKHDNLLREIDPTTAATIAELPLSLPGETILGANGLAWDSSAGELYAIVKLLAQGGRELVKIDPISGVCTSVGNTGRKFAAIAFNSSGRLFGVTGDGDNTPETLFSVSTINASSTQLMFLGDGTDGEALAYNPDDGLLYHASGIGKQNVDEIFETIDPTTLALSDVTLSGHDYEEVAALGYQGSGVFLVGDVFNLGLFRLTSGGQVTYIGELDHSSKGIVVLATQPVVLSVARTGGWLRQVNPSDGSTIAGVPLTLPGETIVGGRGLAWDPVKHRLYALLELSGQVGRELVTIDPPSGSCQSVGDTGDLFDGIAFDAGGTLYGVTNEAALVPETLFELSTADATPTSVLALGGGGDGEALAANLDDGLLYRASGAGLPNVDETFESIDPVLLAVNGISLSGDDYQEALALTCEGSESFLLADAGAGLHRVGTDGAVTLVGGLSHASQGLAVVPSIDCALLDPSAFIAAPVEITGLKLSSASPTAVEWARQDDELWYDVVGGLLSELHGDGGTGSSTCLESGIDGPSFVDARPVPAPGDGFYYLVRAHNVCMHGSYGQGTAGPERPQTDSCP